MRRTTLALILLAAPGPAAAEAPTICADPAAACGARIAENCLVRKGAGTVGVASNAACADQMTSYLGCLREAASKCSSGAGGAGVCDPATEAALWREVKSSQDPDEYAAFAKTCSARAFADIARIRIRKLRAAAGPGAQDAAAVASKEADDEARAAEIEAEKKRRDAERRAAEALAAAARAESERAAAEKRAADARAKAKALTDANRAAAAKALAEKQAAEEAAEQARADARKAAEEQAAAEERAAAEIAAAEKRAAEARAEAERAAAMKEAARKASADAAAAAETAKAERAAALAKAEEDKAAAAALAEEARQAAAKAAELKAAAEKAAAEARDAAQRAEKRKAEAEKTAADQAARAAAQAAAEAERQAERKAAAAAAAEAEARKALARAAQTELRRLRLYRGGIDGVWGRGSAAALRRFQTQAGRPATGALDETLLVALKKAPTPPRPEPAAAPAPTQSAAAADAGAIPRMVGMNALVELRRLGYYAGPIDGVWRPSASAAMRAFQNDTGREPTGRPSEAVVATLKRIPTRRSDVAIDRSTALAKPQKDLNADGLYRADFRCSPTSTKTNGFSLNREFQVRGATGRYEGGILSSETLTLRLSADGAFRISGTAPGRPTKNVLISSGASLSDPRHGRGRYGPNSCVVTLRRLR